VNLLRLLGRLDMLRGPQDVLAAVRREARLIAEHRAAARGDADALHEWPRDEVRDRGLHQARLAPACAQSGELDRAKAEGANAFAIASRRAARPPRASTVDWAPSWRRPDRTLPPRHGTILRRMQAHAPFASASARAAKRRHGVGGGGRGRRGDRLTAARGETGCGDRDAQDGGCHGHDERRAIAVQQRAG
jgi:hypothetical protein